MRVAICSRSRLFREGIRCILTTRDNCEIVAAAASPKECLAATPHNPPQAVVFDFGRADDKDLEYLIGAQVYGKFGVVVIAEADAEVPGLDKLVTHEDSGFELVAMLREVAAPDLAPVGRRGRKRDLSNPFALTAREFEMATMISRGLSNRAIAEASGLKEQTVKNMVSRVLHKLRCDNRVQVALRVSQIAQEAKATV